MEKETARVKPSCNVKQLESKIKGLTQRREQASSHFTSDIETIQKRYFGAVKEYNDQKLQKQKIVNTQEIYHASVKDREIKTNEFRKIIINEARYFFDHNLSLQGHRGDLMFDKKAGSLDLHIQMNASTQLDSQAVAVTTDTKALSGGERAYTLLSFIMALCESMQAPFRAMDEFDCFMDSVNRRVSLNHLLRCASEQKNRQFIFITPQDITDIPPAENIKVQMLRPPLRGQRTLN